MVRPSMACPTWGSHGGTKAQREFGRLANHISISESPCPPCLCEIPFFGRGGHGSSSMTCPAWGSHGGTKAQREIGRLANHISISESPCPPCLCEMLFFSAEADMVRPVWLALLGDLTEAQRHRGRLRGSRITLQFPNLRVPRASVRFLSSAGADVVRPV